MKRLFLILLFLASLPSNSFSSPIISGISANEINIDSGFNGTKILLFGAKSNSGHILVAVRGPKKHFLVTKKQKLFGVWYNGKLVEFQDSYGFYSDFSTTNNRDFISSLAKELEIGTENLRFKPSDKNNEKEEDEFRNELIKRMKTENLYTPNITGVDFLDDTLFKVTLNFPKNIIRGIYTVEIYLIDNGSLSSFQSIPIYVNQAGLSGKIFDFAYQQSFLYGLLAVAIALIFGWFVNYIFVRFFGK